MSWFWDPLLLLSLSTTSQQGVILLLFVHQGDPCYLPSIKSFVLCTPHNPIVSLNQLPPNYQHSSLYKPHLYSITFNLIQHSYSHQNPNQDTNTPTHKMCNHIDTTTPSSSALPVNSRRSRPICKECSCLLKWDPVKNRYWCSRCGAYVKVCSCCGGAYNSIDWSAPR
jgi:hypothetical protein